MRGAFVFWCLVVLGCGDQTGPAPLSRAENQNAEPPPLIVEHPALGGEDTVEGEEAVEEVEPAAERPAEPAAPPDVAAPPANAQSSASGLAWVVLSPGRGRRRPRARSRVTVHYTGWRAEDGDMFDSSVVRGQPSTFALNALIAGWTEGLQLMVEGERRRFWIPAELAYAGRPTAPQGMLVFDIELISIDTY